MSEETVRLSQAVADLQVLADSRLGELCALQSRLEATLKEVEDLRARVMSTSETVPRRVHLETLDVLESEKRRSAELSDSMTALRAKVEVERSRSASALQDLEMSQTTAQSDLMKQISAAKASTRAAQEDIAALKSKLARSEALLADYEALQARLKEQQDLATSLQSQLKMLRGGEYPDATSVKGVVENVSQLQRKVEKLSTLVKDRDIALETLKAREKDVARSERNAAAFSGTDAAATIEQLTERVSLMEKELRANEARVVEARGQLATAKEDHEKLSSHFYSLNAKHEAIITERDGQLQVIQSLSEGYEDLSSQNARLLSQIEDVSARVTSVMQESLRYSGQVDSLTKEKADVEQQLHACQDLVAVLRKEIRDGKAALDQMRREHEESLTAIRHHDRATDVLKKQVDAAQASAQEHRALHDAAQANLGAVTARLQQLVEANEKALHQNKRDAEAIADLQRKLGRAEKAGGKADKEPKRSKSGGSDADTLNLYRRIVRCSVCSDNLKDVVITKCYHAFCSHCVDENIKSRSRKCPVCGLSFGQDDVKQLFLS